MSLVTFKHDVFPYCFNDTVELTPEEKQRVDAYAKANKIDRPYVSGSKDLVETVEGGREADVARAAERREATRENNVDQAAVLQAQREAVAEPANVDALGALQETPAQVVTGTAPVADVEVSNAQVATDTGSGEGVDVVSEGTAKASRSKK